MSSWFYTFLNVQLALCSLKFISCCTFFGEGGGGCCGNEHSHKPSPHSTQNSGPQCVCCRGDGACVWRIALWCVHARITSGVGVAELLHELRDYVAADPCLRVTLCTYYLPAVFPGFPSAAFDWQNRSWAGGQCPHVVRKQEQSSVLSHGPVAEPGFVGAVIGGSVDQ